ncbi:uncharacterized protein LOC131174440 [Hevea brasiliensis]|uniref:uncharacterized protein LOC131174440 n=1 Tax=Hevea brasiliensis TaxID=3981 RepID=UPI0025E74AA8|nr:uncharacterized protein LOC131174440 [Hevea brasiliensis]
MGKLCIPNCFVHELLVREAYGGGLASLFGKKKTLGTLKEHFFSPSMMKDVHKVVEKCVACKKAKSKELMQGLYTHFPVPSHPRSMKERFPSQKKSKLKPRVDGPFRVVERINDNAYKIDLPSGYNVSATFNVRDLFPSLEDDFEDGEELDLRANPN